VHVIVVDNGCGFDQVGVGPVPGKHLGMLCAPRPGTARSSRRRCRWPYELMNSPTVEVTAVRPRRGVAQPFEISAPATGRASLFVPGSRSWALWRR
jgi:hypothetical protein